MSHTTFTFLMVRTPDSWDCVERREFERQTIDNNKGFVLQIPFLEHVFGTLYYVIDKQNGCMMGIVDDQLQGIDCGTQMEPFDLDPLSHMVTAWEQKRQGFNDSSAAMDATDNKRMRIPNVHLKILDLLIPWKNYGSMVTCWCLRRGQDCITIILKSF